MLVTLSRRTCWISWKAVTVPGGAHRGFVETIARAAADNPD